MTVFPGKNILGNNIVKVENVFSKHFTDFLYKDCQKQLKFNVIKPYFINLYDVTKRLHLSNSIIDCHGLNICENSKIIKDWNFPYSIKNWNIFCLKMQNIMFKYCDQFNIDKSELAPHSCWVERSNISENNIVDVMIDDTDILLNSICDTDKLIHYRIIYFLRAPNSKFGLTIVNETNKTSIPVEENCLYIVPSSSTDSNYHYTSFPTDNEDHFVLMFNWYLHPKQFSEKPAWVFPNKYNFETFKTYIKDNMNTFISSSPLQKTLYKHYLIMFQKELKEKLAEKEVK